MSEGDVIKSGEIFEKGYLKGAAKEAEDLYETIEILTLSLKELIAVQKEGLATIKKIGGAKDAKGLKETADALNKITEARKQAIKVDAAKTLAVKKLDAAEKEAQKTAEKEKKNSDEYIKAQAVQALVDKARIARLKAIAIEQSNQIGLEQKLLAANTRLRLDRAALTGVEADYKEQLKAINEQLDKNNALIKENSDKQKQQALTVGDYKNQIKEALAETTGFGSVIAKVTGFVNAYEETLRAQKVALAEDALATTGDTVAHEANIAAIKAEEAATQKLSLAKRALNAITSPAGIALALVAAFALMLKYLTSINQEVKDFFSAIGAAVSDLGSSGNEFSKLEKLVVKFRKEINGLKKDLQELNDTAGDLGEQANDETLALGLRKQFLDEAAKARIKAAEKEVEIALRKKEIVDQELKAEESRYGNRAGSANQEFYDAQAEAAAELFEANDKLGDLDRILSQEKRKFTIQEITDQIELIRSKKLGADSAVETLKKQVADETTILTNRRASLAKLETEQKKAQDEEIQLLTEFGLSKKEIDDLIAETDAVALARELKSFGQAEKGFRLSVGQTEELAKVVLEAQKNKLDRTDAQNKLDDKAIENAVELVRLEKELLKTQQQAEQLVLDETIAEKEKKQAIAIKRSFNDSQFFNKKTEDAALKSIEEKETAQEEANKAAQAQELQQYEDATKLIRDEVLAQKKEKELGDKEIEILHAQHLARVQQLNDKYTSIQSDKVTFLAEREKERTDKTLKGIAQVTTELEKALDARAQREAKEADRAINKREQSIEIQQRLAERGLDNTLAFERKKLAEQEVARKEAEEKAVRQQQALALAQQFNGFLQAALKETPTPSGGEAIMSATRNTFLAKGIAEGFMQFAADGNNMIEGAGTTTSDSIPFMLSKKEAVIKASENVKHNDAVVDLNGGVFGDNWIKKTDLKATSSNIANSLLIQQNEEVKSLLREIANRPIQQVNVDQLGNIIETVYKNGVKNTTTHIHNLSKKRI